MMRRMSLTAGCAVLLLGMAVLASPKPAYAQRNPCLGDGVSTQQEIDRRCAAARGRPYPGAYAAPRYEPRYERRDPYAESYRPRRAWRDYDDDDY